MSSARIRGPARRKAVDTICQPGCCFNSSTTARPSNPDAPMTATLNMRRPSTIAGGRAEHRVTGFVDRAPKDVSRLARLDRDPAGREIDLHLRGRVLRADGLCHRCHAMLAAQAFYLKFDHRRDLPQKMRMSRNS